MSEGCFKPYWASFGVSGTHFWCLVLTFGLLDLTFDIPGLAFGFLGLSLGLLGLTSRVSWEHLGASGKHFGVLRGAKDILFQQYRRYSKHIQQKRCYATAQTNTNMKATTTITTKTAANATTITAT